MEEAQGAAQEAGDQGEVVLDIRECSAKTLAKAERFRARMEEKEAQRRQDGARVAAREAAASEAQAAFFDPFAALTAAANEKLAALEAQQEGAPAACDALLEGEVRELQQLVARSSRVLGAFDLEQSQAQVDNLRRSVAAARARAQPAKKFSFKRKRPRKKATAKADAAAQAAQECAANAEAAAAGEPATARAAAQAAQKAPPTSELQLDAAHSVRGMEDAAVLVCGACGSCWTRPLQEEAGLPPCLCREGGQEAGGSARWQLGDEFQVSDVRRCRVAVQGRARMVRITDVHDSEVFVGPVAGSVMLMRCSGSVFHFAARQCRIHTSTDCEYHIATRSNPIIEDCTGVRFGCYTYTYPGIDDDRAQLSAEQTGDAWKNVQDFNWLKVGQASPNWSTLPAADT